MPYKKPRILHLVAIFAVTLLALCWAIIPPYVTEAEKDTPKEESVTVENNNTGKIVLINLATNQVTLKNGDDSVATMSIVSQGRPGSYYETIGGAYMSDYKEPVHFSSIGHVYMPLSVHVFGNFFIHGIPYYPNGEKVSSTYSGGCIRLEDSDAKKVYDFVSTTTKIIITKDEGDVFNPTYPSLPGTVVSMNMTRLMVATISLEFLTQDDAIVDTDKKSVTTRRKLLYRLLANGDDTVSNLFSRSLGEATFVKSMNDKAKALGLTNTVFTSIYEPAVTTEEDYGRFMNHIVLYKSYLLDGYKDDLLK